MLKAKIQTCISLGLPRVRIISITIFYLHICFLRATNMHGAVMRSPKAATAPLEHFHILFFSKCHSSQKYTHDGFLSLFLFSSLVCSHSFLFQFHFRSNEITVKCVTQNVNRRHNTVSLLLCLSAKL